MKRLLFGALLVGAFCVNQETAWPQAFPINTDVALQPAEGQFIYRTQLRYRRFEVDAPGGDGDVVTHAHVLVYGWTARFSTVLGVPLRYRHFKQAGIPDDDVGVGDINLLARYQLWKQLGYLSSQSWTVLGGLQVPTFDDPFSSRSFDPVMGTVYSWRRFRHGFDADLVYQLNTHNDRDFEAGDVLRYDLTYQYRVWPAHYASETRWTLSGLLEANGAQQWKSKLGGRSIEESDGQQLFLSPGLVLSGWRLRLEAGLQVPVLQAVGDGAQEDDVRFVLGLTVSF